MHLLKKGLKMNFDEYQKELAHLKQDGIGLFEIRLVNGDITCIKPYFDGHTILQRQYHKIMAQHGLYIDKLIGTNDKYIIAELVRGGYAQEHYQEWAENGEDEVQKALLEKGLYIDILSQSKDEDIRFEIAKRYTSRTLNYLKALDFDEKHWYGFDLLMSQTKPNVNALKFLLTRNWHKTGYNLQILKSKYRVMHKVQTVIEKTMSSFQLYQARNPLWKQNLSGYNISCVKHGQKKFDNKNLLPTEDDFKVLSCCTDTYTVDRHVEWRLANRKD